VACLTICLALFPRVSVAANPAIPATPSLDCVRFNGDQVNPIYTAYFGYNNTGTVQFTFAVGADNAVAPGRMWSAAHARSPSSSTASSSPLTLSTTRLPHATYGKPYTASLTVAGGSPPYTWHLTDGSLPAALA
jgi:hypothetical protein